jgi:predicted RNA polymerase sigma factor
MVMVKATKESRLKVRTGPCGDLLRKLGCTDEARAEFEHAAALARNARERALLLERAAACAPGMAPR